MKRFVLGMTALMCVMSVQSKKPLVSPETDPSELDTLRAVELQGVQVVSTRASKKTPVAYTNMSQQDVAAGTEVCELRTGYPLSALADTKYHDDFGCGQRHRLYLAQSAWY